MYRVLFVSLLFVGLVLAPVRAEDTPSVPLRLVAAGGDKAKDNSPQIASLDDAKTVDEVKAFLTNASKNVQRSSEPAEQLKQLAAGGERSVAAGEKIVAIAKDDTERESGLRLKLRGLKTLVYAEGVQLKDKSPEDRENAPNKKKLDEFLSNLEKEGTAPAIVNDEKYQAFVSKHHSTFNGDGKEELTLEKFQEFVRELKKWSNTKPIGFQPVRPLLAAVTYSGTQKAKALDPNLTEKTIKDLIAFVRSDESTISAETKKDAILQLEGFGRRAVGADPKLYGKTLDDKDFDWSSLRGKYVVVKFTASWCGPCKGEIPGLKKAYENYHDKGLEIISIYVWDKLADSKKAVETEKLPWVTLSEELSEKAGLPPQGKAFAVSGVPTMFIVDKEGKILTEARGEKLQEKLAELFAAEEKPKTIPAALLVPKF